MCLQCDVDAAHDTNSATRRLRFARRRFLAVAAGVTAGLAWSGPGFAKDKPPPKPDNVLSPDAALSRLMKGNERYVQGVSRRHDFKHEREPLTLGQNPFAGILSCADSRIAPEYCFDTGRGDLFVCRVAGNFANAESIASFEYAVHVLALPMILVLGHQACGAVDATIKSIQDNTTLPGHLPSLVEALSPSVKDVLNQPGNLLDNATRRNVIRTMEALRTATPILSKAVAEKKVLVAGGIYELATGRVAMIS
ncbi:carbonic anhydrase [Bradyrhizobium prioriisuperbiae]|uniref:carbonic anhydrase n=1 Tax=Bradyrhizobium prioriisuperbiae TaxID=2854389 RepID=UPI0028E2BC7E|nr:carbonic anhydrase [Bradyrhizobium prioritasuperba]